MDLEKKGIKNVSIEKRLSTQVLSICKKFDVEPDVIDWKSELQNTKDVSDKTNWAINLIKNYSALSPTEKIVAEAELRKDNIKKDVKVQEEKNEQENKVLREEEEDKLLSAYTKVTNTDLLHSPEFYQVKERINMVAKGFYDVCFIISDGGWAKTHTTFQLTKDIDTAYISCKVTPLELYKMLYQNKDRELIILDDLKWDSEIIISILKGAWQSIADGKRLVQYNSSKMDIPKVFDIKARFICLANRIPNNTDMKALTSRTLLYEFKPIYKEKIHLIEQISKKEYKNISAEERRRIYEFIEKNTNPSTLNLNLRTFQRICDIYRYKKKDDEWIKLAINELKADDRLALVYELVASGNSVDTQIETFREQTGMGRATYFRIKKNLV